MGNAGESTSQPRVCSHSHPRPALSAFRLPPAITRIPILVLRPLWGPRPPPKGGPLKVLDGGPLLACSALVDRFRAGQSALRVASTMRRPATLAALTRNLIRRPPPSAYHPPLPASPMLALRWLPPKGGSKSGFLRHGRTLSCRPAGLTPVTRGRAWASSLACKRIRRAHLSMHQRANADEATSPLPTPTTLLAAKPRPDRPMKETANTNADAATSPLPTPTTPCSPQSLALTIHLPSLPPPSPTMEEGARHAPRNEAANADADTAANPLPMPTIFEAANRPVFEKLYKNVRDGTETRNALEFDGRNTARTLRAHTGAKTGMNIETHAWYTA